MRSTPQRAQARLASRPVQFDLAQERLRAPRTLTEAFGPDAFEAAGVYAPTRRERIGVIVADAAMLVGVFALIVGAISLARGLA